MAQLARKLQRIFGGSAGTGEFGQIGSKAAGSPATTKDLDTMQSLTEYLQGLFAITSDQGTSRLPYSEDINSLFFLTTTQIAYILQNGISEWLNSADQRYYADVSFVVRSGRVYRAILGDDATNINTQKDPLTEPTWWQPWPNSSESISASGNIAQGRQDHTVFVDTTSGDVAITLTGTPRQGDKLTFVNEGTGGNHITGLPGSISLGDDKKITFTHDGSAFTYPDVIIDEYEDNAITGTNVSSGTARITKWAGGRMEQEYFIDPTGAAVTVPTLPEAFVGTYYSNATISIQQANRTIAIDYTTAPERVAGYSTTGSLQALDFQLFLRGRWKA